MDVGAWCGRCGQRFRLAQIVQPGAGGRCPRCGEALVAPAYTGVMLAAVRRLADAASALDAAGAELVDVAPHLHIDTAALAADLIARTEH